MSRPFKKLYDSRRWRKRSRMQLQRKPLCEHCERAGHVNEAVLSHHIVPHDGDYNLFFFGLLESLCLSCHLREHNRAPVRGYFLDIGIDGQPRDLRHPYYRDGASP